MKINTDGAFHSTTGSGGWGFVIRDSAGTVRGAGVGRLGSVASAAQAEAEACMQALVAASHWGMSNVAVETDCQILVKALQSKERDLAPEGVLNTDI